MSTSTSLCCCNYSSSAAGAASNPNNHRSPQLSPLTTTTRTRKSRRNEMRCSVLSSHSNPKLIKSNLRSTFGQPLSPYHSPNDDHCDDDDVISLLSCLSILVTYFIFAMFYTIIIPYFFLYRTNKINFIIYLYIFCLRFYPC